MTDVPVPQLEDRDGGANGAAVDALWELTRVLREHCPWDQAQTAGTIVPHTLEEAWEVADAARSAEAALAAGSQPDLDAFEDELGDLLFQVSFLAMWCGEHSDGEINMGSVARRIFTKLVRRHPHVFGAAASGDSEELVEAQTADEVLVHWNRIKRDREQRSLFGGIPEAMPPLARARKVQSKAAGIGFEYGDVRGALADLEDEVRELREAIDAAQAAGTMPKGSGDLPDVQVEAELGDVLYAAVNVARFARVEPEIALRDSTATFQSRVEHAIELADEAGEDFVAMDVSTQEVWYQRAKEALR